MSIWGEEIIGIIKLRHRLNEMLRKTGHGHIGYCIAKSYRGRGYGKEMLRQGLEILRSRPDFADEYIMLSCDADNIASLRTQLSCGGITYRADDKISCQIFSGKKEAGFEPSDFDPTDFSVTPFEEGLIPPCPPKMVICFFLEQIEALVQTGELLPFFKIPGENVCQLYRFRDSDVLVMPGFVGSPMTGGVLDEGDPTPRYCIVEIDLETGEKLAYQGEFKDSLKAHVHELKSYQLEKKALLESNI
jgi:hypothetical protein